jgi:hypothetical protein
MANHGTGKKAGKIGALADQSAQRAEVLGYLVERPGLVRQLEKGVGITFGDA